MKARIRLWLIFSAAVAASALLGLTIFSLRPDRLLILAVGVWGVGVPLALWRLWRRVGPGGLKHADAVAIQWQSVGVLATVVLVAVDLRSAGPLSDQFITGFMGGIMVVSALVLLYRIAELLSRIPR